MGDDEDFELERLRQAALNSLRKNREKKARENVNKARNPHQQPSYRPVSSNRNLIEIQTRDDSFQDPLDPSRVEEIVIAEGPDIDDADCDEVVEEVIMSDASSEDESPTPDVNGDQSENVNPESKATESSSDDDALSVASRYSLYEDDFEDLETDTKRLPVRVRLPGANSANSPKEIRKSTPVRSPRRRSRSRSRSRDKLDKSPKSPLRRRHRPLRNFSRSRSKSPIRRRVRRSRSREFRRRSISRDRDKRRTAEPRRPRISPSRPSKNYTSRRRSRSLSANRDKDRDREKEKPRSNSSKIEGTRKKSKSKTPELRPVPGVAQEVLEKRIRKFQKPPETGVSKKIKLQSDAEKKLDTSKPIEEPAITTTEKHEKEKSPTGIQIKVDQTDAQETRDQEDLRTRLIKKKLKAQSHTSGSGRIFTEALKGTKLISDNGSGNSNNLTKTKRKVSLSYS